MIASFCSPSLIKSSLSNHWSYIILANWIRWFLTLSKGILYWLSWPHSSTTQIHVHHYFGSNPPPPPATKQLCVPLNWKMRATLWQLGQAIRIIDTFICCTFYSLTSFVLLHYNISSQIWYIFFTTTDPFNVLWSFWYWHQDLWTMNYERLASILLSNSLWIMTYFMTCKQGIKRTNLQFPSHISVYCSEPRKI